MSKKLLVLTAATVLAFSPVAMRPAFAVDEYNTVPGLTAAGAPLGLHGVDPVAFIELGNRVDGSADYTAVYDGVAYYFATKANMETFQRNPSQYIVQNGGFCTYGVSVGAKFDGDPQYADVVDGKLYVFLNEAIFNAYQQDRAGTIAKAERRWRSIRSVAASDLMADES